MIHTSLARFFKQAITYTVLLSMQLGTLVQSTQAYAQYAPNGQYSPPTYTAPTYTSPTSGYTPDGVLYMGGQRIGNPHQILHDAQIPAFMTITATQYTFTNNPNHGQGTLAQMELATTTGSDSSVLLNRLYLSPTNPYVQGAPGPPNYQTYQEVLANSRQANYLLTNADDGKSYAFKTLTAANRQAVDLLIRELPNTSQFKAAADPLGGGTGVRVTQNGDAAALAAYMATVKPYDYSWQPNFGNGQNNPAFSGWANSNNFAPDYSEGGGAPLSQAAFIKQLQDSAVANDKRVRSQTAANGLDLSGVNPNSLFGEGYNLFAYGSNSNPNRDLENDFLKRLQSGLLAVGSADYLEASRIAQERYRIAYATRLETNKPLQYSVADAQRKANELQLGGINPNELFGQGFDLFQYNKALRANGEAENALLARLQAGELTPGTADYLQATQIAQERLRVAYSQSLVPPEPKKVSKWKMIAGVVAGAVLTFVTAGAAAPFIGAALTGATVAATTAAIAGVGGLSALMVGGVAIGATMATAITAVAGIVGSVVGAVVSTSITTGSFSEGLKAGGKALVSGSVKAIVVSVVASAFGLGGLTGLDGMAGTISNVAMNTISGAVSQTILGGGSFADNLKTAAISSVVTAVSASAANVIGDAFPNADGANFANYAAHAVLGCASAAAKKGDCAAGAVGAVAGEAAAATGFLDAAANSTIGRTLTRDETIFFGGLVGGTAAAAVGSADKVQASFATGTDTASNAVTNNYLNHTDAAQLLKLQKKFNDGTLTPEESKERNAIIEKDQKTNAELQACAFSTSTACQATKADFALAQQSFLPTQTDIQAWANKQAANSPYSAAELIDAYNANFTKGVSAASLTTSGDLNPAADWIREQLSKSGANVLDPIYMGWAVANSPSVGAAITSGIIANQALTKAGSAVGGALGASSGVATPYGFAIQSTDPLAIAARAQVQNGAVLYRVGTTGKSETAEAQFWSLEHPNTPGFAQRYGIPAENVKNSNFIEASTLKPGTQFVTRQAPGVGANSGGGIEVVVPSGGVQMKWFTSK